MIELVSWDQSMDSQKSIFCKYGHWKRLNEFVLWLWDMAFFFFFFFFSLQNITHHEMKASGEGVIISGTLSQDVFKFLCNYCYIFTLKTMIWYFSCTAVLFWEISLLKILSEIVPLLSALYMRLIQWAMQCLIFKKSLLFIFWFNILFIKNGLHQIFFV